MQPRVLPAAVLGPDSGAGGAGVTVSAPPPPPAESAATPCRPPWRDRSAGRTSCPRRGARPGPTFPPAGSPQGRRGVGCSPRPGGASRAWWLGRDPVPPSCCCFRSPRVVFPGEPPARSVLKWGPGGWGAAGVAGLCVCLWGGSAGGRCPQGPVAPVLTRPVAAVVQAQRLLSPGPWRTAGLLSRHVGDGTGSRVELGTWSSSSSDPSKPPPAQSSRACLSPARLQPRAVWGAWPRCRGGLSPWDPAARPLPLPGRLPTPRCRCGRALMHYSWQHGAFVLGRGWTREPCRPCAGPRQAQACWQEWAAGETTPVWGQASWGGN